MKQKKIFFDFAKTSKNEAKRDAFRFKAKIKKEQKSDTLTQPLSTRFLSILFCCVGITQLNLKVIVKAQKYSVSVSKLVQKTGQIFEGVQILHFWPIADRKILFCFDLKNRNYYFYLTFKQYQN
jgi:hypothetical protein